MMNDYTVTDPKYGNEFVRKQLTLNIREQIEEIRKEAERNAETRPWMLKELDEDIKRFVDMFLRDALINKERDEARYRVKRAIKNHYDEAFSNEIDTEILEPNIKKTSQRYLVHLVIEVEGQFANKKLSKPEFKTWIRTVSKPLYFATLNADNAKQRLAQVQQEIELERQTRIQVQKERIESEARLKAVQEQLEAYEKQLKQASSTASKWKGFALETKSEKRAAAPAIKDTGAEPEFKRSRSSDEPDKPLSGSDSSISVK